MSDNIPPFEIQAEILKRVSDVKSLLQFRSVSKSWKSLIDSPQFIADYRPHPPRHHVFVWYMDQLWDNFVSIVDNHDDNDSRSFAQLKFPLVIPDPVKYHGYFGVYGSSKGLFFLFGYSKADSKKGMAVLWNPTIRKSVTIDVPKVSYKYTIGFGISPYSSDLKLVRIRSVYNVLYLKPRQVEIYSLSTGEWRTLPLENLPRSSVEFNDPRHVAIGKYIFWHAKDRNYENGMLMKRQMVILFDMTSDKFMEIYVPDSVTKDPYDELSLFKIGESLAVVF